MTEIGNLFTSGLVNTAGALLFVGIGLFVATLRGRGRANLGFALFLASFGAFIAVGNVSESVLGIPAAPWYLGLQGIFGAFALAGVVLLLVSFPGRVGLDDWGVFWAALGGSVYVLAFGIAAWSTRGEIVAGFAFPGGREGFFPGIATVLFFPFVFGGLYALLFSLALRWPSFGVSARREATLFSAALVVYVGFTAGAGFHPLISPFSGLVVGLVQSVVGIGLLVGLWGVWLWNVHRVPEESGTARNMALLALALPLVGLVHALYEYWWGYGVARTIGVLILSYSILKHQLLGIELKMKWTLRKSTVAGVFIASFFVVSESAAEFLGAQWGTYAGIVSAGALLFALAPLQRVANRFADVAMPGVEASEAYLEERRAVIYRTTVESLMSDGHVTTKERRTLLRLQEELGLSGDVANRVEASVLDGV